MFRLISFAGTAGALHTVPLNVVHHQGPLLRKLEGHLLEDVEIFANEEAKAAVVLMET